MDPDDRTCALLTAALDAGAAEPPVAAIAFPVVPHIGGCAWCRGRLAPLATVALSPRALELALPPRRGEGVLRGGGEKVFVLFDGSEGDPPRQLTIVAREAGASTWDLRVTAEPPLAGVLLMTIGVQNFAGRFRDDGSATIAGIPAAALTDPDAPGLEIAILPDDERGAGRVDAP